MKLVKVPDPVKVEGVKEIPFKEWLVTHMDSFEGVKTPSQVRQAAKIVDVIEKSNGEIAFEDADYEVMKAAIQKTPYFPKIARQLVGYYDAFDKAEEVKK